MSAIGELIVWIIYLILCIPPLWVIALLILREKQFLKRGIVYLSLALTPLILFGYKQYSNHRKVELQHVGSYYLTEFPNCNSCILYLKSDNSFSVTNSEIEIEQGKWKYRSGGDYWIVDIGEYGQLGTGNYKYNHSENNFKK